MTPTQTTLLTHALTAIISAAITYAVLTAADPIPEPVSVESIQAEERIRLRAEGDTDVRDSLDATESRISQRPTQRAAVNKKWAQIASERANVTDSVAGAELVERINGWGSNVECMSSGTYTEPLNYATNFNVPLLIHIVVCSTGLITKI